MATPLDKRLVLAEWMLAQFGYAPPTGPEAINDADTAMKSISALLRGEPVGWDGQNVSHFHDRLKRRLPEDRHVTDDDLIRYDRHIVDHWSRVVRRRETVEHRELRPLYFQYLALLLTEVFLDRWSLDRHLYQPLIYKGRGGLQITIKPTALNKHERQFLFNLKDWCQAEEHGFLADKELYVLRNQSRGRGISFFEEGGFYPDFVLWLFVGDRQYITFVDPHGLGRTRLNTDPKVQFSRKIKEIERNRLPNPRVVLNSFILSPTPFREVNDSTDADAKDQLTELHVLFMQDDEATYVQSLFDLMTRDRAVLSIDGDS